jgi:hypothetical protein
MNKDEPMLKYLWNDNRIFWNIGHFLVSLRNLVNNEWDAGIRLFLSATTSKVLFMSVNNV